MPKIKTKRGAAKRFKTTKSGKVKRKKQNLRHILTSKSTKNKRGFRKAAYVAKCDEANIRKLIPYG